MGNSLTSTEREATTVSGMPESEARRWKKALQALRKQRARRVATDDADEMINEGEFAELVRASVDGDAKEALDRLDIRAMFQAVARTGLVGGAVAAAEEGRTDPLLATSAQLLLWIGVHRRGSDEDKLRFLFTLFDNEDTGVLGRHQLAAVFEILRLALEESGVPAVAAVRQADSIMLALDSDRADPHVDLDQWLNIGLREGLARRLLGPHFQTVMSSLTR